MKSIIILIALACLSNAFTIPKDDVKVADAQKNVIDQLIRLLGLDQVWDIIVEAGSQFVSQLIQVFTQVLFAGAQVLAQVQAIAAQMVQDLLNHVGNAATVIQNAIDAMLAVLGGSGKREVADAQKNVIDQLIRLLGLDQVWDIIVEAGSQFVSQLIQVFTQVLFAGAQVLAQVQAIAAQMVQDLLNHVGNAATVIQNAIDAMLAVLSG